MKHRTDLLALTLDDLTVLANRGLVKRAQREVAAGQLSYALTESDGGSLNFSWSDGTVCELSGNEQLDGRHCSCTATNICRHLLRSILAYQQVYAKAEQPAPVEAASPSVVGDPNPALEPPPHHDAAEIWNPGDIPDQTLGQYFRPAQLKKLRQTFDAGQVISVTVSRKPTAQFHRLSHTVRFLVPQDLRYTYCDCAEQSPCAHVAQAVWAFRQLPEGKSSGIISTESLEMEVPESLLDDIDQAAIALANLGLAGLSPGFMAQLKQLEQRCHQAALIWPANLLEDLLESLNLYRNRDARFDPAQMIQLLAELCIRSDAIRAQPPGIPQLLIRGPRSQRLTDLGATRLMGLGCGARIQHHGFQLDAYFQDLNSGQVFALSSELKPLPEADVAKPLPDSRSQVQAIAQTPAIKQTSWTTLGAGQLLIKRGACSPRGQLQFKRNQSVTVNPQSFAWDKLRAPLLVEDFKALCEQFKSLPPQSLRPRRLMDSFYVFAIAQVKAVTFSSVEQSVLASLYDPYGNHARLSFPYSNQAHDGAEALLSLLQQRSIRFISGQVTEHAGELWIRPIAIVPEQAGVRQMLQPWIYDAKDSPDLGLESDSTFVQDQRLSSPEASAIQQYLQSLRAFAATLLTQGLSNVQDHSLTNLSHLSQAGHELGFQQLSQQLTVLQDWLGNETSPSETTAQAYLVLLVWLDLL